MADFPWEREAMEGLPAPGELSLSDQKAYQALASLYSRYRLGQISRETGSAEKKKILFAWKKDKSRYEIDLKLTNWHVKLHKEIECAHSRYRKDRTLENADRLSNTLDGILEDAAT